MIVGSAIRALRCPVQSGYSRSLPVDALLLATSLAWCVHAGAADGAQSKTEQAKALLSEAQQLVVAKDFAKACPKLAASQELDPKLSTLMELSRCREDEGKLATALMRFRQVIRGAEGGDSAARALGAQAKERAAKLEPRVPTLTLRAPADASAGLEIRLNGAPLGKDAWSVPLPLDPGSYEVSATEPGKPAWSRHVDLKAGAAQQLVVDMSAPPPLASSPPPPPPLPSKPVAQPAKASGSAWSQRDTAYVVGGVGVAGLVFGAATGGVALAKKNDCSQGCDSDEISSNNEARNTWATLSTIGFGVGLAGVGVATVLLLTAKPSTEKAVRQTTPLRVQAALGSRGAGLVIGGTF